MKISIFYTLIAVVIVVMLGVCMSFCCSGDGLKGEDLTFYQYHVGNGYSGQSTDYSIYEKDGVVTASIKECNFLMMREDDSIPCNEYAISDVPREKLIEIGKLLVDAKIQKWERDYYATDVFDGDNWSVSVRFGDKSFDSHGYMKWPKDAPFHEINRIIGELCMPKEER
ncbi:MAG: hypothetical protein IK025_02240 [Bacteroidales bacterium]|nr:hypothetical protein [Bacteroidales bacterium]